MNKPRASKSRSRRVRELDPADDPAVIEAAEMHAPLKDADKLAFCAACGCVGMWHRSLNAMCPPTTARGVRDVSRPFLKEWTQKTFFTPIAQGWQEERRAALLAELDRMRTALQTLDVSTWTAQDFEATARDLHHVAAIGNEARSGR